MSLDNANKTSYETSSSAAQPSALDTQSLIDLSVLSDSERVSNPFVDGKTGISDNGGVQASGALRKIPVEVSEERSGTSAPESEVGSEKSVRAKKRANKNRRAAERLAKVQAELAEARAALSSSSPGPAPKTKASAPPKPAPKQAEKPRNNPPKTGSAKPAPKQSKGKGKENKEAPDRVETRRLAELETKVESIVTLLEQLVSKESTDASEAPPDPAKDKDKGKEKLSDEAESSGTVSHLVSKVRIRIPSNAHAAIVTAKSRGYDYEEVPPPSTLNPHVLSAAVRRLATYKALEALVTLKCRKICSIYGAHRDLAIAADLNAHLPADQQFTFTIYQPRVTPSDLVRGLKVEKEDRCHDPRFCDGFLFVNIYALGAEKMDPETLFNNYAVYGPCALVHHNFAGVLGTVEGEGGWYRSLAGIRHRPDVKGQTYGPHDPCDWLLTEGSNSHVGWARFAEVGDTVVTVVQPLDEPLLSPGPSRDPTTERFGWKVLPLPDFKQFVPRLAISFAYNWYIPDRFRAWMLKERCVLIDLKLRKALIRFTIARQMNSFSLKQATTELKNFVLREPEYALLETLFPTEFELISLRTLFAYFFEGLEANANLIAGVRARYGDTLANYNEDLKAMDVPLAVPTPTWAKVLVGALALAGTATLGYFLLKNRPGESAEIAGPSGSTIAADLSWRYVKKKANDVVANAKDLAGLVKLNPRQFYVNWIAAPVVKYAQRFTGQIGPVLIAPPIEECLKQAFPEVRHVFWGIEVLASARFIMYPGRLLSQILISTAVHEVIPRLENNLWRKVGYHAVINLIAGLAFGDLSRVARQMQLLPGFTIWVPTDISNAEAGRLFNPDGMVAGMFFGRHILPENFLQEGVPWITEYPYVPPQAIRPDPTGAGRRLTVATYTSVYRRARADPEEKYRWYSTAPDNRMGTVMKPYQCLSPYQKSTPFENFIAATQRGPWEWRALPDPDYVRVSRFRLSSMCVPRQSCPSFQLKPQDDQHLSIVANSFIFWDTFQDTEPEATRGHTSADFYFAFIMPNVPMYVPRRTDENMIGVFRGRILVQAFMDPKDQAIAWVTAVPIVVMSTVVFPRMEDWYALFKQWYDHLDTARQRQSAIKGLRELLDSCMYPTQRALDTVEVFVKGDEALIKGIAFKPRPIMRVHEQIHVYTGPFIYEAYKRLSRWWSISNLEESSIYVKNLDGSVWHVYFVFGSACMDHELSQAMAFALEMPPRSAIILVAGDDSLLVLIDEYGIMHIIEGDASSYDFTQSTGPLGFEYDTLFRLGVPDEIIAVLRRNARARLVAYGAKKEAPAVLIVDRENKPSRNTGGSDTTIGNTTPMAGAWATAIRQWPDYKVTFATLGFDMKWREHSSVYLATFLKGMWFPTDEGPIWGPLPSRVLKFGKSLRDPRELFPTSDPGLAAGAFLNAVGRTYSAYFPTIVLRGLVQRVLSFEPLEPKQPLFEGGMRVPSTGSQSRMQCSDWSFVAEHYGVSVEDLLGLEYIYSRVDVFTFIEHPLLARMAEVDYM